MAKFSIEVWTEELGKDYWRKMTGEDWDDGWAQAWVQRRSGLLSQELTPEDVAAQLGLQIEAVEDEKGLHVTVSPLDKVLQGRVVEDSRHGLLRKAVVSKYHTDGIRMNINADPTQYVEVELGTSLREPTYTILYVFPNNTT